MPFTFIRTAFVLLTLIAGAAAQAQQREEARLVLATQALEQINAMPDQGVPDWLLARAHGIAVIPNVIKVGLGIGGRGGKGVLTVRDEQGRWSNPVFVRLAGGSFGWQAGVQAADVVLVFTTKAGIDGITDGKLTLGADASVAAGPVGRATSVATDPNFSAEVYSYSRTRGLFAGLALDAAAITIDRNANATFYAKRDVTASEIMAPTAPEPPATARRFLTVLETSTRAAATGATASAESAESAAPAQAPAPATAPAPAEPVKTFPMEDPSPGQEPQPPQ
jgi:lipid-binding SYLF domain-containing protein